MLGGPTEDEPARQTTAGLPPPCGEGWGGESREAAVARGRRGIGSYEDPSEQRRKDRTKGKTGRPGR